MSKRNGKAPQFERGGRQNTKDRTDDVGLVFVRIGMLRPDGGYLKGSLSKAFSVREAKVSEVAAFIEQALFATREDGR